MIVKRRIKRKDVIVETVLWELEKHPVTSSHDKSQFITYMALDKLFQAESAA